MRKRILIVDDEPDILEILRFNLEAEGYDVETSESPCDIEGDLPHLILLDVMMSPKSGFDWARELKATPTTKDIPIIFCTAKTTEKDVLTGFGLGSDDYICKPFRISEVKARVAAVLRRTASKSITAHAAKERKELTVIRCKGIKIDLNRKECWVDGEEIPFTKLELELLALLISSPGQVFSRDRILHEVWPEDTIVLDRTVDVKITSIRKKIGRYGKLLKTKIGYGYLFEK